MKPPRDHRGENGADVLNGPSFADIDRQFARFIERLAGAANSDLALAAALVSRSRGEGNICLELRRADVFQEAAPGTKPVSLPEFDRWMTALRATTVVGSPGEFKPLVLDAHGRLYLHRYWEYESTLAMAIRQRVSTPFAFVNDDLLREGLERFFPGTGGTTETDWQRIAAETAVRKNLCVISGGPGTGKTRTVAVILALLLEQASGRSLRIALAAPTGKAAARLQESLKLLKAALPCAEDIKKRLPEEAFTLHRLLGGVPGVARYRYNATNPLPFDVVVVDEASMVDLALMAKLFDATRTVARIVLLGDKDQLASVEAGAVLGDICADVERSSDLPLSKCIVQLQKNYRFGEDDNLLALSQAINSGDAVRAIEIFGTSGASRGGLRRAELAAPGRLKEQLREHVLAGFGDVLRARDAQAALQALGRFRILCALRQGPYGVEALNRLAEEILIEEHLIPARERWYGGRPVMVTRNDYSLKLFNGDVGVILPDEDSGEPRAWFLSTDNTLRGIPPVRLPEHETVFAMTVHKSQGSEFEEVLLILPDRDSPVLTRELLYTGATRASHRMEAWFNEPVFRTALTRRVERTSGLREALWGQSMVLTSQQERRPTNDKQDVTID